MSLNIYSEFKNVDEKLNAYTKDIKNPNTVFAEKCDGTRVPLKDVSVENVDRVGDLWRVQTPFTQPIRVVRKKEFVIAGKDNFTDHTGFLYYRANPVGENCYGKFVFPSVEYVVAEFVAGNTVYDAYGKTRDDARAYLALKVLDAFQPVIQQAIKSQRQK